MADTTPITVVGDMDAKHLYAGLKRLGLLYDPAAAVAYGTAMEHYSGPLRETAWFHALPEELRRRYSFCVAVNGMKFALAAESFHRPLDRKACSAAVCFILAGCILDNLLDEGSPAERRIAREKLVWGYCERYFVRYEIDGTGHVVDRLYSEIALFLRDHGEKTPDVYGCLLEHLRRAVRAEVHTSQGTWKTGDAMDIALVADRSVLFTVIGFELALFGMHTPEEWEVFFLIGDIFRIIDDLCDAEADSRAGRVNSLLMKIGGSDPLWAENALEDLARALARLERSVSTSFFAFLRYELQSWTLSNPYLYQKMLEESPCPM